MAMSRVLGIVPLVVVLACATEEPEAPWELQAMSFANSEWAAPVHLPAPVNSSFRELAARLSPDGLSLYFGSDRTQGSLGGFDIWVSHRACTGCAWEEPVNLGPNINSPGADGSPELSADGHLLFFSGSRDAGQGGEDIWVSRRADVDDDRGWEPAVNLGPAVNTVASEAGPEYVPALEAGAAGLYFTRGSDVFQVRITRDGEAAEPAVPVAELNDPTTTDGNVTVRADGREAFFWSNRLGGMGGADIWVATRRSPHDVWSTPENAGPVINTGSADLTPSLSHDGRTLLFSAGAAARPSLGLQDIWMTTRNSSGH